MIDGKVRFPDLRRSMIYYLDLVQQVGMTDDVQSATEDLEYIVHYFFDDTEVAMKTSDYLGDTIISEEEVDVVRQFGTNLDNYLNKFSPGAAPLVFQEGDDWNLVMQSAKEAKKVMDSTKI